jgi:hypothetical protein
MSFGKPGCIALFMSFIREISQLYLDLFLVILSIYTKEGEREGLISLLGLIERNRRKTRHETRPKIYIVRYLLFSRRWLAE